MPRRLRIHLPGGFYHATLRGNHQRSIFHTESDPWLLNDIVARALAKYQARLHAYCWMSNHVHLLVQVGEAPLSCFMRQVASEFARRMQWHMPTSGHFFERRYHATLVDAERYLKAVVRYIHLNPIAAGLVADPADYAWSSHHEYLGLRQGAWVTTDDVLGAFGATRSRAMAAYRAFLEDRAVPDWSAKLEIGPDAEDILGDEEFVRRMLPPKERKSQQSLDELVAEGCRQFMVAETRLASPLRDSVLSKVRAWIAAQARIRGIATLSEAARRLERSEATLRQAMREQAAKERAG
jgi:putative transposase